MLPVGKVFTELSSFISIELYTIAFFKTLLELRYLIPLMEGYFNRCYEIGYFVDLLVYKTVVPCDIPVGHDVS